ncbi:ras GEF [Basidiobolus meristosporus CBS 931.73]|uniref:Ras GEF n=1 Tax=Basidiobolus meristosporus CBS 931.73 TaxID=1314790 RepID=A0A1Y1Z899_9FUNG|nr:ras GEF [Basidiobolus meristosporus CBS 931.73]|eukprot:ORY06436.1 ras GEF [Basidiobolus meristosporus CBS 931.73]
MPSQKIETYFKRKGNSNTTSKLFKTRVLDIDAAELAKQLTLHDSYLFNLIKPVECMNGAWHHEEDWMAVNIKTMLRTSERIKYWIARTIISEREPSKRGFLISYFINVATECINLRNFNTCMAILEGLRIPPIPILRTSWQLVGQKSKQMFEELKVLMTPAGNFPYYRRRLASLNGDPCVPYLSKR